MKTVREKADEKREAKLEEIRAQLDSGTLVVRHLEHSDEPKALVSWLNQLRP
jgi:hypothetical protein